MDLCLLVDGMKPKTTVCLTPKEEDAIQSPSTSRKPYLPLEPPPNNNTVETSNETDVGGTNSTDSASSASSAINMPHGSQSPHSTRSQHDSPVSHESRSFHSSDTSEPATVFGQSPHQTLTTQSLPATPPHRNRSPLKPEQPVFLPPVLPPASSLLKPPPAALGLPNGEKNTIRVHSPPPSLHQDPHHLFPHIHQQHLQHQLPQHQHPAQLANGIQPSFSTEKFAGQLSPVYPSAYIQPSPNDTLMIHPSSQSANTRPGGIKYNMYEQQPLHPTQPPAVRAPQPPMYANIPMDVRKKVPMTVLAPMPMPHAGQYHVPLARPPGDHLMNHTQHHQQQQHPHNLHQQQHSQQHHGTNTASPYLRCGPSAGSSPSNPPMSCIVPIPALGSVDKSNSRSNKSPFLSSSSSASPKPLGQISVRGSPPTTTSGVSKSQSKSSVQKELNNYISVMEVKSSKSDIDTKTRQFACQHCGRCFFRKSDLVRHIQIHLGIKPNVCELCGKQFIQKSALTVHRRVHTGEKPYQCQVCNRAFSDSSSLARHRRIHAREDSALRNSKFPATSGGELVRVSNKMLAPDGNDNIKVGE